MRSIPGTGVLPPSLSEDDGGVRVPRRLTTRPSSFPDRWNRADARGVLYGRQGRVCAFCGSELAYNDRGDVEHFRPKSSVRGADTHDGYWWLAYDLANLMLACRVCNSSLKGTRFPLLDDADERITFATRDRLDDERRALILALVDPVEDLLDVDLDNPLLRVVPAAGLTDDQRRRAEAHIAFFRLNTAPQLILARKALFAAAEEALDAGATERVLRVASRHHPHSRAVLALLDAAGVAPPTRADERRALVEDLAVEVVVADEVLAQAPGDEREPARKYRKEVCVALVTILRDAPAAERVSLEQLLADLGLRDAVRDAGDALLD